MKREIPVSDFVAIASQFDYLAQDGDIRQSPPSDAEMHDDDNLDLHRVSMLYTAKGFADLRPFIDAINRY